MLRELSLTVSPILALLLLVLTPVGTGQGNELVFNFDLSIGMAFNLR